MLTKKVAGFERRDMILSQSLMSFIWTHLFAERYRSKQRNDLREGRNFLSNSLKRLNL